MEPFHTTQERFRQLEITIALSFLKNTFGQVWRDIKHMHLSIVKKKPQAMIRKRLYSHYLRRHLNLLP